MLTIDLTDRTAFVSGSTQGIGLAIAQQLAEAGARVAVNGRSPQRVQEAIDSLAGAGVPRDRLVPAPGDVTAEEGLADALEAAGEVDVLVNNLGIFGAAPALEISDAEWQRYWDVNVMAAVRLIRATLPGMKERG